MMDHPSEKSLPKRMPAVSWLLGLAMAVATIPSDASAETINLRVTGTIKSSCYLNGTHLTVAMPKVSVSELMVAPSAGERWANFSFVTSGCVGVSNISMQFQGASDPLVPSWFKVFGGARNVALEIRKYDDDQVVVPNVAAGATFMPSAGRPEAFRFRARYVTYPNTLPVPGQANAHVTVLITLK